MLRQVKCRVGVDTMVHLRSMAHRGLCGFYVQTGDAYNEQPLFRLMRDGAPFALFFARSVCNIPRTPYNIHCTACNAQRTPTIVQHVARSAQLVIEVAVLPVGARADRRELSLPL
jgi:hypothetical protein